MIEMEINGSKRLLTDRYESWIGEQLRRVRQSGQAVWVKILIGGDIKLFLPIGPCPQTGGGGGSLSPRQQDICNFYKRSKVSEQPITPGNIVSFLKALKKFLRSLGECD